VPAEAVIEGRADMENRWYEFKPDSQEEIVASFAVQQPEQEGHGLLERLPEDDPRVQTFLGPIWARRSFQRLVIESTEDLVVAYRICSMSPRCGFRGQSDYDWPLETPIERDRDKILLHEEGLEQFEQRVLVEAKRRAHLYIDKQPDEFDSMGWFSLLRHLGVPTRLLDISWSIFIATSFAVEKNQGKDGCVWAFNRFQIDLKLHEIIMRNKESLFLKNHGGFILDNYQPPTYDPSKFPRATNEKPIGFDDIMSVGGPNIKLLFELALNGVLNIEGLIFVEPHWMNKRMDMQQGAFLVPLNLRKGFSSNLLSVCSSSGEENEVKISEIRNNDKAIQTIQKNASALKFRILASAKNQLGAFLDASNIRKLVLFPDIDGLCGYLSDLIPSGKIFSDG
jgi:hypothetical protein